MAISDDLNSIRTHLEDDYKALETLGVSIEDRNIENIKDMANQIYAKFPKTDYAEGSNITLENCLKGKLDYEDDKVGYGDTEQEGEPTPTTPIPIQVVTGEQEVVVRGKNVLDITPFLGTRIDVTTTKNGNYLHFSGKPSRTNSGITVEVDITNKVSKFEKFTLSVNLITGSYPYIYRIVKRNSNDEVVDRYSSNLSSDPPTITVSNESGYKYGLIFMAQSNIELVNINCDLAVQIEEGDIATTYEPYITPITKQLSLGNKELYEDSFISKENGNWYFNDNYGKINASDYTFSLGSITIDGQTYSQFSTPSNNPTPFKGGLNTSDKVKCNKFLASASAINKFYINSGRRIVIVAPIYNGDYVTTLDSFNENIKSNMYLIGELETAIKTPITDTTLINQLEDIYNMQSVNGTTIIEINGNLPMIMKVRALKNG